MENISKQIKKITKSINLIPTKELYRERALLYNKLEKFDLAMNDYEEIIKLDPKDYNAYYERACEWYNWKIYYLDESPSKESIKENTIMYLKNSLKLKETSKSCYRIAEIYFNLLQEDEEALKYCKKAILISPNEIETLKLLGEVYNELEEYNNAIKMFNSALKLCEDSDTFLFRGITYCNLANHMNNDCDTIKMYKNALNDYENALRLDSENVVAYMKMAQLLESVFNETQQAIKCYKKILELEPYNERANEAMANYYYDIGNYKNVIKYINKIGVLDGLDYLELRKAESYYELGKYNEALEIYNRILKIKNDKIVYDYRGDVYLKLGEYDKAISDYENYIKLSPEAKGVYYRLGLAYKEKGDDCSALKVLEKALELLPANEKILKLINGIKCK